MRGASGRVVYIVCIRFCAQFFSRFYSSITMDFCAWIKHETSVCMNRSDAARSARGGVAGHERRHPPCLRSNVGIITRSQRDSLFVLLQPAPSLLLVYFWFSLFFFAMAFRLAALPSLPTALVIQWFSKRFKRFLNLNSSKRKTFCETRKVCARKNEGI